MFIATHHDMIKCSDFDLSILLCKGILAIIYVVFVSYLHRDAQFSGVKFG